MDLLCCLPKSPCNKSVGSLGWPKIRPKKNTLHLRRFHKGWNRKITIFNGKIHYKWPFSIAMLVHQRVNPQLGFQGTGTPVPNTNSSNPRSTKVAPNKVPATIAIIEPINSCRMVVFFTSPAKQLATGVWAVWVQTGVQLDPQCFSVFVLDQPFLGSNMDQSFRTIPDRTSQQSI